MEYRFSVWTFVCLRWLFSSSVLGGRGFYIHKGALGAVSASSQNLNLTRRHNHEDISDMEGFYNEIDKLLTKNLQWKTGHNLNAFNDLLRGGFGVHEYEEPIIIRWVNFEKSKKTLGDEMVLILLEIMLDCDNSGHDVKVELVR